MSDGMLSAYPDRRARAGFAHAHATGYSRSRLNQRGKAHIALNQKDFTKQQGIAQTPLLCANPFPWMAEMIDLKKEKNFFETRVTEYQSGGALSWD
jgi:hypothetical protein